MVNADKEQIDYRFERSVAAALAGFPKDALFIAAVSGGADSTAMLLSLARLRAYRLHCLHVNHGIRPPEENVGDEEAVRSLCTRLGVPLTIVSSHQGEITRTAKGIGIEAAARVFRHDAWTQELQRLGALRVLTAHTKDDLLETALMRVLRGSGPSGLCGIKQDNGTVFRPLLTLTRADVLNYLGVLNASFRNDSSNTDINFLRNRIRHTLVPVLDKSFSDWRKTVFSFTETQSLTAEFLEKESVDRIKWTESEKSRALWTEKKIFFQAPSIVREEALFHAVDRILDRLDSQISPSQTPRRAVIRLFCQGNAQGPARVVDAGSVIIVARSKRVIVSVKTGRLGTMNLAKI
ncbi:MAG: tRNA lysidine(34) synthetase TilS [Treponema sp.]|jgi:tRNA(Ile)-lysidine synthase|nr:tRNA lysidine(34) synthetase TilS [Treponema sp.]